MAKRRLTRQQTRRIRQRSIAPQDTGDGHNREGLIIAHYGQQVEVEDALDGVSVTRCYVRANLGSLVTGDRVIWQRASTAEEPGIVTALRPRQTLLSRPDTFRRLRPVAANVDQMIIVIAAEPEPHANLIDRYLVAAELVGMTPLIVLNKTDLLNDPVAREATIGLLQRYTGLGYACVALHCQTQSAAPEPPSLPRLVQDQDAVPEGQKQEGMPGNWAALIHAMTDKTSILVGQSGVGKSSIVRYLIPDIEIRIGALSEARAKGTHTTTTARLYHLASGGDLIDSPGIRKFGLWHVDEQQLLQGYCELWPLSSRCRFRDCHHFSSPGCALSAAEASGAVSAERCESYRLARASLDEVDILET